MKRIFFSIVVLSIFIFTACEDKDQWKLPTDVAFRMDINKGPDNADRLSFHQGSIVLSEFEFEGRREQGEDVYFSAEFEKGLTIVFDHETDVAELDFDIPQGIYKRVSISFETRDDDDEISILVLGTYTDDDDQDFPLRFEFTDSEEFEIEAKNLSDDDDIVLNKEISRIVKVMLDPIHWFDVIPYSMFDDADHTNIGGIETIVISEEMNEDIFELIVDRIDESTEAIFN